MYVLKQIRDYGINIKTGTYVEMMQSALRLLLVFFSCKNNHYIRGLTTQFCIFSYWKAENHPVFALLNQFPQSLHEEDGELSLSLLCQASLAHGIQRDRSYLAKLYKLMHLYRKAAGDVNKDLSIRLSPRYRHTARLQDPEIGVLGNHFRRVIRRLSAGTWQHYPKVARARGKYPKADRMANSLVNTSMPRLRLADFRKEVRKAMVNIHRLLILQNNSTWMPPLPVPQPPQHVFPPAPLLRPLVVNPIVPIPPVNVNRSISSSSDDSFDDDEDHSSELSGDSEDSEAVVSFSNISSDGESTQYASSTDSDAVFFEHRFQILAIRRMRVKRRRRGDGTYIRVREYLVRWRNFPQSEDETWETEATLRHDCPDILDMYHAESS